MAATKTTGLTELTTPAVGDMIPIVDIAPTPTTKKITLQNLRGGYVLIANTPELAPADATSYFFGSCYTLAVPTAGAGRNIPIPRDGTITAVTVFFRNTVTGTSISSTISLRLNNTSDTTISSVVNNSTSTQSITTTGLSVAVTTSDFVEIKWVTPTWASNPTTHITAYIYVS